MPYKNINEAIEQAKDWCRIIHRMHGFRVKYAIVQESDGSYRVWLFNNWLKKSGKKILGWINAQREELEIMPL